MLLGLMELSREDLIPKEQQQATPLSLASAWAFHKPIAVHSSLIFNYLKAQTALMALASRCRLKLEIHVH